jgi:hypothetical protein
VISSQAMQQQRSAVAGLPSVWTVVMQHHPIAINQGHDMLPGAVRSVAIRQIYGQNCLPVRAAQQRMRYEQWEIKTRPVLACDGLRRSVQGAFEPRSVRWMNFLKSGQLGGREPFYRDFT